MQFQFATIKLYQGKLTTIKKEMVMVHDRTFKLKVCFYYFSSQN